jgi:hypothetical protein
MGPTQLLPRKSFSPQPPFSHINKRLGGERKYLDPQKSYVDKILTLTLLRDLRIEQ